MIDKLNERYDTIYRKALEGLDRSQADEEIRTVTDCPADDSKNKRLTPHQDPGRQPRLADPRPGRPGCHRQAAEGDGNAGQGG